MIYLELFLGFLKVGLFSFGGAYAAIPLIRDVVLSYGWLTDTELSYMIAVSESTPGPVMVNLATYVGAEKAGILGAAVATLTVILPAFVIILLIMVVFRRLLEKESFRSVLSGLKACVSAVILACGLYMTADALFGVKDTPFFDYKYIIVFAVLLAVRFLPLAFRKKKTGPIPLIISAAVISLIIWH